jgi:hypothetical protein
MNTDTSEHETLKLQNMLSNTLTSCFIPKYINSENINKYKCACCLNIIRMITVYQE